MPSRFPIYHKVARAIKQRIADGSWPIDRPIPSEVKLAQQFGVSVGTVRRAIEILTGEEILVAYQGSGTYVKTFNKGPYWNRFQRFLSLDGHIIRWAPRFLSLEKIPAPSEVALALDLTEGSPVWHAERVLTSAHDPRCCGIDSVYLNADVFTGLHAGIFETDGKSLYQVFEESSGVVITHVSDYLVSATADERFASLTGIPAGEPLFRLIRRGFTYSNQLIEYRIETAVATALRVTFPS